MTCWHQPGCVLFSSSSTIHVGHVSWCNQCCCALSLNEPNSFFISVQVCSNTLSNLAAPETWRQAHLAFTWHTISSALNSHPLKQILSHFGMGSASSVTSFVVVEIPEDVKMMVQFRFPRCWSQNGRQMDCDRGRTDGNQTDGRSANWPWSQVIQKSWLHSS